MVSTERMRSVAFSVISAPFLSAFSGTRWHTEHGQCTQWNSVPRFLSAFTSPGWSSPISLLSSSKPSRSRADEITCPG